MPIHEQVVLHTMVGVFEQKWYINKLPFKCCLHLEKNLKQTVLKHCYFLYVFSIQ